jgi:hypothetical protein
MLCPFSGVITFARAIPEFLLVAWTMCRSLFLLELSGGREKERSELESLSIDFKKYNRDG